jgi:hypothetical protein
MKPAGVIEARLGIQPNGPAHAFFTNSCYNHMDRYVPYKPHQGDHLRENVEIETNYIKYNMPYAHAQYIGYTTGPVNPENYTTPGTGPYWDRVMWSVEKDDIINEVQEYVDTHGGR